MSKRPKKATRREEKGGIGHAKRIRYVKSGAPRGLEPATSFYSQYFYMRLAYTVIIVVVPFALHIGFIVGL